MSCWCSPIGAVGLGAHIEATLYLVIFFSFSFFLFATPLESLQVKVAGDMPPPPPLYHPSLSTANFVFNDKDHEEENGRSGPPLQVPRDDDNLLVPMSTWNWVNAGGGDDYLDWASVQTVSPLLAGNHCQLSLFLPEPWIPTYIVHRW